MKLRRGSGLILVLIVTAVMTTVLASVLDYARSEKRLNSHAYLHMEAKNAVESVLEYGFAQLHQRFNSLTSFSLDSLQPTSNPLILPDEFYEMYDGTTADDTLSEVVLPAQPYVANSSPKSQSTELIGGVVPPGQWTFISETLNEDDDLKGKRVFIRGVELLGRATVQDTFGNQKSVYATQTLQVRDAPLFAHAIFYNLDMEIAPGPEMHIYGPVHANGDIFVQSNNSLNFHQPVSTAGAIYHGPKDDIGKSTSSGNVRFVDRTDTLVDMNDGTGWLDSDESDWKVASAERWHYNVQSGDHGIEKHNPVAIDDYVPDDPSTFTDELRNYAYQLIQSSMNNSSADYDEGVEQQKFAYNAGLTIEIDTATGTASYYTYNRDAQGNVVYDGSGNPEKVYLTPDTDFVQVDAFNSTTFDAAVDAGTEPNMMWDKRRGTGVGLATIDVGALKDLVEGDDRWSGTDAGDFWTGVVYVEFPESSSPGVDGVRTSVDDWGVMLENGASIPSRTDTDEGMTLATNNVLYVKGDYNADGNLSTGSPTAPDNNDEPPAAFAADAVTILSNDWLNSRSNSGSKNDRPASDTEVSAAILTGIAPSNTETDNYSGGVENFPRFLENWSGQTLQYRGSMVALFESEIAWQGWTSSVYSAPNRDWGFNELFSKGSYPPGTPNNRSFRRVNYRELSVDEYIERADAIAAAIAEDS